MTKWFVQLLVLVVLASCSATSNTPKKINGISFVASRDAIDSTHVQPVIDIHANYAAIMPFGFIRKVTQAEIIHNTQRQWYGETRAGARQYIDALRKRQIKIMIKPQIWIRHGEFTGHLKMTTEDDWQRLEQSYSDFILEYAELAQETNAELFCIGTELEAFVTERPDYWHDLIVKIKSIYKGKLTYAANWDEFKRTPFWDALDYIGVDAYFPVSDMQTPTIEDCLKGWEPHKKILKSMSEQHDKPILFTEFGYRSVDFSGREPWVSDHTLTSINMEAQSNAMAALFETFWNEPWFAGGFIWKWFHVDERVGGENDNQFTPQNKPVEHVIRDIFSKS